jgi:hypothetical protein
VIRGILVDNGLNWDVKLGRAAPANKAVEEQLKKKLSENSFSPHKSHAAVHARSGTYDYIYTTKFQGRSFVNIVHVNTCSTNKNMFYVCRWLSMQRAARLNTLKEQSLTSSTKKKLEHTEAVYRNYRGERSDICLYMQIIFQYI